MNLLLSLQIANNYSLCIQDKNTVLSCNLDGENSCRVRVDGENPIIKHWMTHRRIRKTTLNNSQEIDNAFAWGVCFDGRLAERLWDYVSTKELHNLVVTFCGQNHSKSLLKRLDFASFPAFDLIILFMHALKMGWTQQAKNIVPYVIKNDAFRSGRWVNYVLEETQMKKPMVKKIWTELLNADMPKSRAEIVGIGLIVECRYDFNHTDFEVLDTLKEIPFWKKTDFDSYIALYEKKSQRQRIVKQLPNPSKIKKIQRVKKI